MPNPHGNPQNLKPFTKGWKGGPGRPKKLPITDRYLKALEEPLPDEVRLKLGLKKGALIGDALVRSTIWQGFKGNVKAMAEITDRTEGKAPQRVELTAPEGITLRVVYEDDREAPKADGTD